MEFEELVYLKSHPTWKLLSADNAPMVISFFYHAFIRPGVRTYREEDLITELDDHLFHIRQIAGEKEYPRLAREYLDEWVQPDRAYLRKYYPEVGDEPEFDLTPASEKAIEWLRTLRPKAFVGTESRLQTIFQLLRDVTQATETDPTVRIADLEAQRQTIDAEIARVRGGHLNPFDATQVKEHYLEIEETARRLLADFRQVEENFRQLDRQARERIATSHQSKGALLDEIFGEEDTILKSDQGRSFRAFWGFLMSRERQLELQSLVAKVIALDPVQTLERDPLLPHLKFRLMEAGDKVQKTTSALVEALRRFLDDQAWLENKRIMDLVRSIERRAVELRANPAKDPAFFWMDDVRAEIELPLERGLFVPVTDTGLLDSIVLEGEADFSVDALYLQHFVDRELLKTRIRRLLQEMTQVSLADICVRHPLEKGLSELLAYLQIATQDGRAAIDEDVRQTIAWQDAGGQTRQANIPRIIFAR